MELLNLQKFAEKIEELENFEKIANARVKAGLSALGISHISEFSAKADKAEGILGKAFGAEGGKVIHEELRRKAAGKANPSMFLKRDKNMFNSIPNNKPAFEGKLPKDPVSTTSSANTVNSGTTGKNNESFLDKAKAWVKANPKKAIAGGVGVGLVGGGMFVGRNKND